MSKYQHPKILLVDFKDDEAIKALEAVGYAVSFARLGSPYVVRQENASFPLYTELILSQDYKEQEIVVIDMCYDSNNLPTKDSEERVGVGIKKWWANHSQGFVNPRPLASSLLQLDFDRILNEGGIFVIFSNASEVQRYYRGHKDLYENLIPEEEKVCSNGSPGFTV